MEDSINASIKGHDYYIKKRKEILITEASNITGNLRKIMKTTKTWKEKSELNNCMDTLSEKLARSRTRKLGNAYKMETL